MPAKPIDGGTSLRQSVESFVTLKHRNDEDLPPVPPALDSARNVDRVAPVVLEPAREELKRQVARVKAQLTDRLEPHKAALPQFAWMETWEPKRD